MSKLAIVTGGIRGIGAAISTTLKNSIEPYFSKKESKIIIKEIEDKMTTERK